MSRNSGYRKRISRNSVTLREGRVSRNEMKKGLSKTEFVTLREGRVSRNVKEGQTRWKAVMSRSARGV